MKSVSFGVMEPAAAPEMSCPHCGSQDVRAEKWARSSVIGLFLLTGLPIPLTSRVHRCFDCGGKFKWMNGQAVPMVERTSVFVVLAFIVVIALGGWLVYSWTLL